MLHHEALDPTLIAQEPHVPQLIELVRSIIPAKSARASGRPCRLPK
jgi:hypothetical protein